MKTDIHPKYHKGTKAVCACGSTFEVGSTSEALEVEVCSECHPFYTGTGKIIDTAGRVEKFKTRAAKARAQTQKKAKPAKAKKVDKDKPATPSANTKAEAGKEK